MFCIRKLGIHCILYVLTLKFYKVNVLDVRNLFTSKGALLVGNHTHYLDWALIKMTSPMPIYCVIESRLNIKWYRAFLYKLLKIKLVSDWKSKESQCYIRKHLKQKHFVALLMPNKLSEHAHFGMIHSKVQSIATSTKSPIIPFYLYGLWQGINGLACNLKKQAQSSRKLSIGIAYGKPLPCSVDSHKLNQVIIELSVRAWKAYTLSLSSIPIEWLKRFKTVDSSFYIADALTEQRLSASKVIALSWLLRSRLKRKLEKHERIGLLLPASMRGILAMLMVFCLGKTLVCLNYTLGESFILKAIKKSNLKIIISSHQFMQVLKKRGLHLQSIQTKYDIIYLDDILKIFLPLKIFSYLLTVKLLPFCFLRHCFIKEKNIESIAVILFSSGSEGEAKGIELTHRNILGNAKQMFSAVCRKRYKKMLSTLPMFHAFGLTVTTIFPLIEGISLICCGDPTNVKQLSETIYHHKINVLCAIPSLLGLYVRNNNLVPIMFKSLQLVIAGAEKLSSKIRLSFKQKFGVDIYEGYGATEVSPVASVNLPNILYHNKLYIFNKPGTVGLPLPGSDFQVIDPQNNKPLPFNHFGLILITGVQVMHGYLDDNLKTRLVLQYDREFIWYRSGDKGRLDVDYFLTIIDRYSRIIKTAGEAISLTEVEIYVEHLLVKEAIKVIAIGIPDARKGESIALVHAGSISSVKLQHYLLHSTMARLMQPSRYIHVHKIPMLGNGKKDYIKAKKMVLTYLKNLE